SVPAFWDQARFVIGQMDLEQMEVLIDVTDHAGLARQQEHGTDAASREALDPIAQFIVDVAGGHHGDFAFGSGPMDDTVEHSPPALVQESVVAISLPLAIAFRGVLGESRSHSKASEGWSSEDVFHSPLFQNPRGFSRLFYSSDPSLLYITLGLGLTHDHRHGRGVEGPMLVPPQQADVVRAVAERVITLS